MSHDVSHVVVSTRSLQYDDSFHGDGGTMRGRSAAVSTSHLCRHSGEKELLTLLEILKSGTITYESPKRGGWPL